MSELEKPGQEAPDSKLAIWIEEEASQFFEGKTWGSGKSSALRAIIAEIAMSGRKAEPMTISKFREMLRTREPDLEGFEHQSKGET